jgi:hypothetical protein
MFINVQFLARKKNVQIVASKMLRLFGFKCSKWLLQRFSS